MFVEAILGLRWIERASLYFDLTDKVLGGQVRLLSRRLQPRGHRLALRGQGCRRRPRGPVAEAAEPRTAPMISANPKTLRGLQA